MPAMSDGQPHVTPAEFRGAILTLVSEEPYNGLEIIKEAGERTNGNWRVPDAELYPLLEELNGEGLIRLAQSGGGFSRQRPYELTPAGREYVDQHAATLVTPWNGQLGAPSPTQAGEVSAPAAQPQEPAAPTPPGEAPVSPVPAQAVSPPAASAGATVAAEPTAADRFRATTDRFSVAVDQVAAVGTDRQLERARQLLAESRRGLYQILATEDENEDDADANAGAS